MKHVRHLSLVSVAGLSLVLGTLIYLARPVGSSYLNLGGFALDLPVLTTSAWVNNLPSFFHVLAFSLLGANALGLSRRCCRLSCLGWLALVGLFELGQLKELSAPLQDLPLFLGPYFYNGTFDPYDLLACLLGAGAAYGLLLVKSAPVFPERRRIALGLLSSLSLLVLTACLLLPPPDSAYGSLFVKGPSVPYNYGYTYICPGESVNLAWSASGTRGLRLNAQPPGATEPPLDRKPVALEGDLDVTVKDSVALSLSGGGNLLDEVDVRRAPEVVCTDFDFPLPGWYTGTLTQTIPQALSQNLRMQLYWDADVDAEPPGLRGSLYIADLLSIDLSCSVSAGAQQVVCVQRDNVEGFQFAVVGTATGLSGTYEGSEESGSAKLSFSGELELLKRASEPPLPE